MKKIVLRIALTAAVAMALLAGSSKPVQAQGGTVRGMIDVRLNDRPALYFMDAGVPVKGVRGAGTGIHF